MPVLLKVKNLKVHFETYEEYIYAVNGISYTLNSGETIGIVGESGCGKTVSIMSLLRLIDMPPGKIVSGTAIFEGKDLLSIPQKELQKIRGNKIGVIFQDPMTAFNQVMTIGDQLIEGLIEHKGMSKKKALEEAKRLLDIVGIANPRERLRDYPFQFSGGMRQRVMIAIGLICQPKIIIADEPTTALDVTIQAQIIDLIKQIREEFGTSIIWVTHDLGVVAGIADKVMVIYGGYIIEEAPVDMLYNNPKHPYTRGLLASLPKIEGNDRKRLDYISGQPPYLNKLPKGCPFEPRCSYRIEKCAQENPMLTIRNIEGNHRVACWLGLE